jgi:hypothetical protein
MPACPVQGHAFAECGSPVLFAEMPLDNRTVNEFEGVAASFGFLRPLETSPRKKRSYISSRLIVL